MIAKIKAAGIDLNACLSDTKTLRKVNKILRSGDESHLWPISGRYNATDRAIRWYSRVYFKANGPCTVYEYVMGIDGLISGYVNS